MRIVTNIGKLLKKILYLSVPDDYGDEIVHNINKINTHRGKITALTMISLEIILIIISIITKKGDFLKKPDIFYGYMYLTMIIVMSAGFALFYKFGKNVSTYSKGIKISGIFFSSFILLWCAVISLLDQLSYGQIIVYIVAIISLAIIPVFKPISLLFLYTAVQTVFMILMPYFQKSEDILFGNYINSIMFILLSLVLSFIINNSTLQNLINKKIIQDKNVELIKVNKDLEDLNKKLEKLSQTDSLTCISNRYVFDRSLNLEWDRCKRHSIPLTLVMIDIDYFKNFNDKYGHQAGDDCIKQVAATLSSCLKRSSDIVARYGGEEFAIILPHVDKVHIVEFADQLRYSIEKLGIIHDFSSVSRYVTISIGASTAVPSDDTSVDELIRAADNALYDAKKVRNCVVVV